MSQPGIFWWQKYGTLAQMAQAQPAYLATYGAETQQWVRASLKTASVTPPDCKLGKT
ncbi:MAG: hypothetical protein V4521_10135 [Pseudomonadota bacterium]